MDGVDDFLPWVGPGRVECCLRDMTFVCSASVTLSGLDAQLVRAGWWLPVDGGGELTIEEAVGRDSSGPLRMGFGGWRDLLLGAQFLDGRGKLVSVGGRVMKNVAGYDVTKFLVGARGEFGKLVSVVCRGYRRPVGAVAVRMKGEVDLARVMPVPQWCVRTRSGVWMGWVGEERLVEVVVGKFGEMEGVQLIRHEPGDDAAMRGRLWRVPPPTTGGEGVECRISVPPGRMGGFVLEAGLVEWVGDPWHGVLLARVGGEVDRVEEVARGMGGWMEVAGRAVRVSAGEERVLRGIKAAVDGEGRWGELGVRV